jgi:4-diphosphocytidyl-2-C-methyl-D-erythritol kinase
VSITVRAAAKVNLALGVGPVRPDGYHSLDTVYQAIGLYDDVRVEPAAEWSIGLTPVGDVEVSGVPLDETNLAVRAGILLAEHHGVDRAAALHVDKGIPVAGGLAGGSADAAAALVALDRLWALRTSDDDLLALAAQLGSDVPFALLGGVAHGTGRGEHVEPLAGAGEFWWVVLPSAEGLATPAVYAELDRLRPEAPEPSTPSALLEALDRGDVEAAGALLENDLEAAALSLRPDLARRRDLLAQLHPGPVLLSGSGPTLLALAATHGEATATRGLLAEEDLVAHVAPGPVAGAHVLEVTR